MKRRDFLKKLGLAATALVVPLPTLPKRENKYHLFGTVTSRMSSSVPSIQRCDYQWFEQHAGLIITWSELKHDGIVYYESHI